MSYAATTMNLRSRILAVLNYEKFDRIPLVHFGFWHETLLKWAKEGHLDEDIARNWGDGNGADAQISEILGFDGNYYSTFSPNTWIKPGFESKVIKTLDDGSKHLFNHEGVVILVKEGTNSIPAEIDYTLKGRDDWEREYKHRFTWDEERLTNTRVRIGTTTVPFTEGGLEQLKNEDRDEWIGLDCGSLFGRIRNILGVENSAYLYSDDEELFDEIVKTSADLCYRGVEEALATGAKFDFAHFWEDICFKNGPLISPNVFKEKVGPHYKRITKLLNEHGINIISLDCDGLIDHLIPTWLENGVNTMFPIEVGTWDASIAPWREKYGKDIRGVGGMNKNIFARDRSAVDEEVARLEKLIRLGGYIPCPDHRIAPDAKWELVQYYCQKMHKITF